MPERRIRAFRLLFCAGWFGVLILVLKTGSKAHDTNPEHLIALIMTSYLAAWGPYFLLSREGPALKAARFALLTVSVLACVSVLELAGLLGVVDYRVVFSTPTPPWRRTGNRPDAELLYIKEGPRRVRLTFQGAELSRMRGASRSHVYECDLRLDRNGFRNATEKEIADVIVIGDSFIEGLQVADSELITTHLSRLAGRSVVNLGRTSYGPQQELHVLRRYGLDMRPRTCVWAFYEGNDLQDLNSYEVVRKNLRWIVEEKPTRSIYARSFTRNCLGYVLRSWLRPDPGLSGRLHTGRFVDRSGRERELFFATGVQHGEEGPQLPRGASPELMRFRAVLSEVKELCGRTGIDLVVVFVPAKFRIYRGLCKFDRDSPCRTWEVDDLSDAIRRVVRETSPAAGFVDLTPRFLDEAAGELLYLPDDTHWSPAGHRLAASVIADFLTARGNETRPQVARAVSSRK
jgi:hypothetical protein